MAITQNQESVLTKLENSGTFASELEKIHRKLIDKFTGRIIVSPHLNPDWKIGFIGEPGDCKTISATKLTIRDFMLHGIPCYSNMHIKVTVRISDDNPLLQKWGLPGGEVIYETNEFDKYALFRFDERFRKSVIFVDEINLEMAEARRSSSNLNLNTNKVGQELRHLEAALIFTVINEMWVDGRIRELTNVFFRTQDTALDAENLALKKTPGEVARLMMYPMSRKINGQTYYQNQKAFGPYYLYVRDMWSAYDTLEIQASEALKYGIDIKHNDIIVEDTENHKQVKEDWDWLNNLATDLFERGELEVPANEFYNHPEVVKRGYNQRQLTELLKSLIPGLRTKQKYIDGFRESVYVLPQEM